MAKQAKKLLTRSQLGDRAFRVLEASSSIYEVRKALPSIKKWVHFHRNKLKCCPFCNRSIADREESIYMELIRDLYKVYRWCGEHKRHEFEMKDIKHLLGQVNYTRFGNLDHYGGIVYRPTGGKKGAFGINMERAREFFRNERAIPVKRVVCLITGETIAETKVHVKDFPELSHFMNEEGVYDNTTPVGTAAAVPSTRGLPFAN